MLHGLKSGFHFDTRDSLFSEIIIKHKKVQISVKYIITFTSINPYSERFDLVKVIKYGATYNYLCWSSCTLLSDSHVRDEPHVTQCWPLRH